jgi:hypothetical protein
MLPGVGGRYWTTFFPAVVVLGLGMAVSVAPLTTTVMSAVGQEYSGVASGVNNAISRVGGLLSIAVFGIVAAGVFSLHLDHKLSVLNVQPQIRSLIYEQRTKLAGIELPPGMSSDLKARLNPAVKESYVAGFRSIMGISVLLALFSSLSSWLLIEKK